ncbi:protein KINESIN LIGHT CHAIN-RELATED 1-like [Telopea speciosissima]|uniref:protein KINESIN LIGHT CHAIN-RELATED 1-like n=1 Tax=Telopea speciosissima TaxID=54955 RepID=UPI001CC5601E|nr:protein KINESIN LIGHT CHAIN-RELATED 1-like [Telopea speciosissima]
MEFQQRVIDAWESHGPSARDEFREAHRLLEQLKKKARGSSSDEVPTKALLLPRISEVSSIWNSRPNAQRPKSSYPCGHIASFCPPDRKIKQKSEMEEAFASAQTLEEIFQAFEDMASAFDEEDLCLAFLKASLNLNQEGEDHEKGLYERVLDFGNRALKILESSNKAPLPVAVNLHVMGAASYLLKRYNDSLGYLNRANRILIKLEEDGVNVDNVRHVLYALLHELYKTNTAMGRSEEAIVNLERALELQEKALGPECKEVGMLNRNLAQDYVAIMNFKDALPFCLKALEIHEAQLGNNSVEVAHDRRILGLIYSGLEEHEKATEQNELSKEVLKNQGLHKDQLSAEIGAAGMQIALGRYNEALNSLKDIIQRTDEENETPATVFLLMAKVLCNQEKFADSKRYLEKACGILDKKNIFSSELVEDVAFSKLVVVSYMEISMLYETMNEFETAISPLEKCLAIVEKIPKLQPSKWCVSARIGRLLLLTGKTMQAIPYLESASEISQKCFGTKYIEVGYNYNNLGAAYLELDKPQSAAQMFSVAKDIMDASLGPHHADSIEACQNLSKAYGAMGSYTLAMEFQQRMIDEWESHGPSAGDEFKEAQRLLEQLKKKVYGSSSDEIPTKALLLPRISEVSGIRNSRPNAQTECFDDDDGVGRSEFSPKPRNTGVPCERLRRYLWCLGVGAEVKGGTGISGGGARVAGMGRRTVSVNGLGRKLPSNGKNDMVNQLFKNQVQLMAGTAVAKLP